MAFFCVFMLVVCFKFRLFLYMTSEFVFKLYYSTKLTLMNTNRIAPITKTTMWCYEQNIFPFVAHNTDVYVKLIQVKISYCIRGLYRKRKLLLLIFRSTYFRYEHLSSTYPNLPLQKFIKVSLLSLNRIN